MKATIDATVLADAPDADLIAIEGNSYFPPSSIVDGVLIPNDTAYHCPWKGDAQYFDVQGPGGLTHDGAWSYPNIMSTAVERVGQDFAGYVAFDRRSVSVA